MKNNTKARISLFAAFIGMVIFASAGFAQKGTDIATKDVIPEIRPFDFASKFYVENGVESSTIVDRRSGFDGDSVIDFTNDPTRRNVRITATHIAYGPTGEELFWNLYGRVTGNGFTHDREGFDAIRTAETYPIYVFPSTTRKNSERQAALIDIDEYYDEKNPLGIGVLVRVEFTEKIYGPKGIALMAELGKLNGVSLDGTPIIKTAKQIDELTREGMVVQVVNNVDDLTSTPYLIGRVLLDPENGAIAPDAFLIYVKQTADKPLDAEQKFLDEFNCLKRSGKSCDAK